MTQLGFRDVRRPRNAVYMAVALGLLAWMVVSGFDGRPVGAFIVWSCGGALVLEALDRRSDRESSR